MLIDLGMDREPRTGEERWVGGRAGRWLAGIGRRARVQGVVGLALLGAMIPLLGGATFPRPALTELYRLPLGTRAYAIADGRIALVSGTVQAPALSAYRLRDGAPLWTTEVAAESELEPGFGIVTAPGVLLLVGLGTSGSAERTTAYDAATGARLWSRDAWPNGIIEPGAVLMAAEIPGPCPREPCVRPEGNRQAPHEYAAVDLRTGRGEWTKRLTGPENMTAVLDATSERGEIVRRMAARDPNGRLHVWDLRTGAELASRDLPPVDSDDTMLFVHGVLLLQSRSAHEPSAPELSALDPVTLVPRWRSEPLTRNAAVWPCGEQVCAGSDAATIVLDIRTGARVELRQPWQWVADLGDGHQLGYPISVREGDRRRWVLDATGQPLFELSNWDAMESWPGRGYALLSRFQDTTSHAWFGLLDADRRGVVPLGQLVGVTGSCQPTPGPGGGYLICWMTGDRIHVFRYVVR